VNQNLILAGSVAFSGIAEGQTKNWLKDLPDLTVKARDRIWAKSEKARLRLRRAQRRCLIEDSFRLDSGGRCFDQDLATHASTEYALTYFAAVADEYMRLRKSYQQLCKLLTTAIRFVDAEALACWKGLSFDGQVTFDSACLPKVRNALRNGKDKRLEESLEDREASQERPTPTQPAVARRARKTRVQIRKGFVNLTDQQKYLLRLLVSKDEASGGAEFYFTQSHTGAGISYAGIQGFINSNETDLYQLRSERLITLIRVSSNVYRAKPTQLGITMARRDFTTFENSFKPANVAGEGATPIQANAEVAMSKLPELSERKERMFSLRWSTLLDESRLTEKVIVQCANASNVTRTNALSRPPDSTNRFFQMTDYLRARNECGISQSVRLAERWFHELATEYIKLWSPADGYELFASWLESLQGRVLTDVASIWGRVENTKLWYETVCAPAVRVAVSAKLSEFERVARGKELEMHVLAGSAEDEFSKPEDAVTTTEPRSATEQREAPEALSPNDMDAHENVQAVAPPR
jgi:hypothetical protein